AKIKSVHTNLAHINSVSRQKLKKRREFNWLNAILIIIELLSCVFLFNLIFNWYIDFDISGNYWLLLGFILVVYSFQIFNKGLFQLSSPYNWVSELFQVGRVLGI